MIADSIAAIEAVIWAAIIGACVLAAISAFVVAVLVAAVVNAIRYHRRTAEQPSAPDLDTAPGMDLALHDECELMWSVPTSPDLTGLNRLERAIRDEQNGETT